MANESVTIHIGVDDQGTPTLVNVADELDKLGEKSEEAGKGQKDLGDSSKDAKGSMDNLTPALVNVHKELEKIGITLDKTTTEQKDLDSSSKDLTGTLDKVKPVLDDVSDELEKVGINAEKAADSQDELSESSKDLSGSMGKTNQGMSEAAKEIEDLGGKSEDASQGQKSLSQSSKGATGAMTKLNPAMAAGAAAIAGVAAAAGLTAKAIFDVTNAASRHGQEVLRQANALGVSTEAFQGYQYAFEQFGADGRDVSDVFNTLTDRAQDAQDGMQSFQDDFALVGLSVDDLRGKRPEQLFNTFAQSLADTEDVNKRNAAAVRILGDDMGNKLLPLLSQGEEGIKKFAEEASAMGTVMDAEALQNSEEFQRSLARMQALFEGVKLQIGSAFMPALTALFDAFQTIIGPVDSNTDAMETFAWDAVNVVVAGIGALLEVMNQLSPVFSGTITYVKVATQAWRVYFNAVSIVAKTIAGTLAKGLSNVLEALGALIDGAARAAEVLGLDMAESLREAADGVNGVQGAIDDFSSDALESAKSDFGDIGDSIGNIGEAIADLPGLDEQLSGEIEEIIARVQNAQREITSARLSGGRAEEGQMPTAPGGGGGGSGQGEADDDAEEQAESEAERNEIAQIRIAALREENEITAARLEAEAQLRELALQDMTDAERRLERLRIEQSLEQNIESIRNDAAAAERERAREKEEAEKKELERLKQIRDAEHSATQAALGRFDASLSGLGQMASAANTLRQEQELNTKAVEATQAAFSGLAEAGGSIASMITKDREDAAKIEAAFNAAAAIGSFAAYAASGFSAAPLGIAAVQHGIAAAQFAAIAGGAGAGSGSGAGTGARGSSGQSRTSGRPQMAGEMESPERRERAPIRYEINMQGATLLEESPAVARDIRRAVESSESSSIRAGRVR